MRSRLLKRGPFLLLQKRFSATVRSEPQRFFRSREGEHFLGVLSRKPAYYVGKTLKVEVSDACQAVRGFLETPPPKFLRGDVCSQVVKEVPGLSSTSVKALLLKIHSCLTPQNANQVLHNVQPLLAALNRRSQVLIQSQQSLELEFTLAELLLKLNQRRGYAGVMLKRQASALKYLTETDFIQHLFFSYPFRVLEPETSAALPSFVDNVFDELDLEEIALVCFVLYTTQSRLPRCDQWLRIVNAFEKHDGPVADVALGVIAKYLRYITPSRKADYVALEKFFNVVSRRRSEWTLSTHMRLASLGTQTELCNSDIVTGVMPKLLANLDTCRIKDVAMALFSNAYFGFEITRSAADTIMGRLKKEYVPPEHHRWLARSTFSLAVMGFYDEYLMAKSLNRGIIDFATTHELFLNEIHMLYTTCRLMFPDLMKNNLCLTHDDMRYAREKVLQQTEGLRAYNTNVRALQVILEGDFGLKTEVKQTLESFPHRDIHIGKNLIVACHAKHFYSNEGRLMGLRRFRLRLLKAAKFEVVEIHHDFFSYKPNQKVEHLRRVLGDHIRDAM